MIKIFVTEIKGQHFVQRMDKMGKCSMRNLNNKYATLIVSEKIGNLKIEYAMILRGNMIIYDILFDFGVRSYEITL